VAAREQMAVFLNTRADKTAQQQRYQCFILEQKTYVELFQSSFGAQRLKIEAQFPLSPPFALRTEFPLSRPFAMRNKSPSKNRSNPISSKNCSINRTACCA